MCVIAPWRCEYGSPAPQLTRTPAPDDRLEVHVRLIAYVVSFASCVCSVQSKDEMASSDKEYDPNLLLLVNGYNMGMLRVKGDDGDEDQIIRWIIQDKEQVWHDVFRITEPGKEDTYISRVFDEGEEQPKDLKAEWEASFKRCTPGV